METYLFVLVLGALGALAIVFVQQMKANDTAYTAIGEAANERRAKFEQAKTEFIGTTFGEGASGLCRRGEDDAMIGATADGLRLACWKRPDETFIEIVPGRVALPSHIKQGALDFTLTDTFDIPFPDIVQVTAQQDNVVETFTRTTNTPVATAKKKSAIGRGLVGGAVLGPVGMVLGAASGATTTTQVKTVVTTSEDTRVVAGPPTLTLTMRGTPYRIERLEFDTIDQARSWALWIADQIA